MKITIMTNDEDYIIYDNVKEIYIPGTDGMDIRMNEDKDGWILTSNKENNDESNRCE